MNKKTIFLFLAGIGLVGTLSGCSDSNPSVSAAQTLPNDPAQYPNPFVDPGSGSSPAPTSTPQTLSPSSPTPQVPPTGDPRMQLASFLVQSGAKMYTAGWCPQCVRQIEDFGPEAKSIIKQIEVSCDSEPDLCAQKKVEGYPTWEFNGQTQQARGFPLVKLAQLAGFPNPQAFAQMEGGR